MIGHAKRAPDSSFLSSQPNDPVSVEGIGALLCMALLPPDACRRVSSGSQYNKLTKYTSPNHSLDFTDEYENKEHTPQI